MATRHLASATALILAPIIAVGAHAQSEAGPLSAIDWLSSVVENPEAYPEGEPAAVVNSATSPAIQTSALGATSLDAVGLLTLSVAGLPADFWGNTSSGTLAKLIAGLRTDLPSPLARLLQTILLAELAPPVDSSPAARLFLARLDRLLKQGALDQAQALLDRAGSDKPALFARSFDISLLAADDVTACARVLEDAALNATPIAQVFCMMQAGDWQAAEETLTKARAAGDLTPAHSALLERFIAPEAAEGSAVLPVPERITPLVFRLHQAIGEPLGTATLPNAFAYAALAETSGWKARISAAERLARSKSIPDNKLLAIYSETTAAASGGLWDRVDAVQSLERAITAGDIAAIDTSLPLAMQNMRRAGLEPALANLFAQQLLEMALKGPTAQLALRLGLLSDRPKNVLSAPLYKAAPPDPLIAALVTGEFAGVEASDQTTDAVLQAFRAVSAGSEIDKLIEAGNYGQAVLEAITLLQDGAETAPDQIEQGITALRLAGFTDTARAMALSIALSDPDR